tara:strand:- start:1249 stop:2742 length:1494 start_codon:yes stop_codon:yes gene_type:complete
MIKRYFAIKDNTITNAFDRSLVTRGTGSNMGQSDILEAFTIYAQVSSSSGLSTEKARILIEFDLNEINADNNPTGTKYFLKLFNARHSSTLPRDFSMQVLAINGEWEEGRGLDMDNYSDLTYDITGSNWIRRKGATSWGDQGGSTHASPVFSANFSVGDEDLEVDVTTLVDQWIAGSKNNNGFMIRMSSDLESAPESFFTKKFFARSSEFYFSRPVLEARFDDSKLDDRGQFYLSSSLASATDNLNTIYLYNYVRGRLRNIPSVGTGKIGVSLFSSSLGAPTGFSLKLVNDNDDNVRSANRFVVTGGYVSTGIYSASVAFTGSASLEKIHDVWFKLDPSVLSAKTSTSQFTTGSIDVKRFNSYSHTDTDRYIFSVSNRNNTYACDQTHRIRLYAREKGWSPNIFTVATQIPPSLVFASASYEICRTVDDRVVIPYGTGSTQHTRLSYDASGSYFDLDTSILEPNYIYEMKLSIYDPDVDTYEEQPFSYKFRVVKNEY